MECSGIAVGVTYPVHDSQSYVHRHRKWQYGGISDAYTFHHQHGQRNFKQYSHMECWCIRYAVYHCQFHLHRNCQLEYRSVSIAVPDVVFSIEPDINRNG